MKSIKNKSLYVKIDAICIIKQSPQNSSRYFRQYLNHIYVDILGLTCYNHKVRD